MEKELIRTGDNKEDSGYLNGVEFLKLAKRPTAILVCNNLMTLGVLAAFRELGVACPREVSLVGFDDFRVEFISSPATHDGASAGIGIGGRGSSSGPEAHAQPPPAGNGESSASDPIDRAGINRGPQWRASRLLLAFLP